MSPTCMIEKLLTLSTLGNSQDSAKLRLHNFPLQKSADLGLLKINLGIRCKIPNCHDAYSSIAKRVAPSFSQTREGETIHWEQKLPVHGLLFVEWVHQIQFTETLCSKPVSKRKSPGKNLVINNNVKLNISNVPERITLKSQTVSQNLIFNKRSHLHFWRSMWHTLILFVIKEYIPQCIWPHILLFSVVGYARLSIACGVLWLVVDTCPYLMATLRSSAWLQLQAIVHCMQYSI